MGCATSKVSARKHADRESWYAPVSRSLSAPIHYPAESEEDSCHVVSLASCSYGTMETEKPAELLLKGSFVRILRDKFVRVEHNDALAEDKHGVASKNLHVVRSQSKGRVKLKPVQEESPETENGNLETINTWELMEGLDEDGSGTLSPLVGTAKSRSFGKSLSFNTVHELDSCFAEMGSPVWKKYYSHEAGVDVEAGRPSSVQRKLGFTHLSSLSFSGAEEQLFNGYSAIESPVQSSVKAAVKSPERSPMKTPLDSPSKSPIVESSSSPLFDPSLMATFEQALQSIALPQDDWMLTHDTNEESLTNSSASSGNHTWVLSETSSDAESPQSELVVDHAENLVRSSSTTKREMSSKVLPWNEDLKRCLESFEPRCPPRGAEKVVFYFTSLRGVRKTYEDCCEMRLILQGLGVHVDERDVWMHSKFREELTEVLGSKRVQVPQLFIKGRYIGGAEDVKQLHEDGALISLMEDLPCLGLFRKVCEGCADVRFIPCLTCSGSCKVLDDMNQTVRCDKCNENGLIMCPLCS